MKQYRRSARINRLLQEEIADIIRSRLKDPRIGDVTVIRVDTTEDLRSCKVYVSTLDEEGAADTMTGLESATGTIRRELRGRIHARRIPELRFILDRGTAYSIHISDVIDSLRSEEEGKDENTP
jgi:ribosome-binding factor A